MGTAPRSTRTITGLKRWSCQDSQLPEVKSIKAIHIYDFDNTLFCSPLPNKQIWNGPTLGQLQALEYFNSGGWWHDSNILASTGKGIEEEEPRAWEGWWNESIVELVQLSMQQKDALNVLLTGRKESAFAPLIQRMIKAKGLEFDMVCLKPEVGPTNQKLSSTMAFKQELLKDIVFTYPEAEEIRVYEDRPRHTRGFRDFFEALNRSLQMPDSLESRSPIAAEVIQVSEQATTLEPVTEVAEVQRMINTHNAAITSGTAPSGAFPLTIKKTVFYTGYLISPEDTERLSGLVQLPTGTPDHEVRYLANNILITPRPAGASILEKVGGMGRKLTWRITGFSIFEDKLWAARVAPVDPSETYYTENPTPTIVLALKRNARPIDANRISNWQPVPEGDTFRIETVVGEKVLLRVEEERQGEDEWASKFPRKPEGRKQPREEDFPSLGSQRNNANPASRPQARHGRQGDDNRRTSGNFRNGAQGRGGRGGGGGGQRGGNRGRGGGRGGGGGGGGGRGRGRGGQYRSLDDNVANGYGNGASAGMQY